MAWDLTPAAAAAGTCCMSIGVSTGGNTLGQTGITGTDYVLVGIGGITLSQLTDANGGTVSISGGGGGGGSFSAGLSTAGNTAGSTGVTGTRLVLAALGALSGSQSTDANGGTVSLSVPAQSVQAESLSLGVSTIGNTAGNTTVQTGTRFVLVGAGAITASQSTAVGASTVTLSAPVQSVQAESFSVGVSTGGNTAGNTTVQSGTRLVLVGAGIVTASQVTAVGASTITLSASQSLQTEGNLSIGVSTGGNTLGNTTVQTGSRFVFSGQGNVTLSEVTAAGATTLGISAAGGGGGAFSGGVSNLGNTGGSTGVTGTRLVLAGYDFQSGAATPYGISLSQSTDANGGTVSILAPPPFQAGLSTGGNTAGATGVTGTRLVIVASGVLSGSQTTDANGATVTLNAPAGGGAAFSAGVSTLGNTAGSTGVTGTQLVFVGSNDITLSQSTDANGGTVSIIPPSPLDLWYPALNVFRQTVALGNATLQVQPWTIPAPGVQHDRVLVPLHYSQATGSTLTVSLSQWIGLYTRNGSSLSLLSSSSSSQSINGSGTVSSTVYVGERLFTMGWTNTITAGDYWLGYVVRSSTAGANASLSMFRNSANVSAFSGILGSGSNSSAQIILGMGQYSTTTAGMPGSIAFSQLRNTNNPEGRQPYAIGLLSGTV